MGQGILPSLGISLFVAFLVYTIGLFPILLFGSLVADLIVNRDPIARRVKRFEYAILRYDEWFSRTQELFWHSLSGRAFEIEAARLFRRCGHRCDITPSSNDGGVDFWTKIGGKLIPVQCKAHKKVVGPAAVRELFGVMNHHSSVLGICISISGFSKGAIAFASGKNIILIGIEGLIRAQRTNKITSISDAEQIP